MLLAIQIFAALFAVVYAYFRWRFQFFARRGVPFLEPHFPTGSSPDFLPKKRNLGLIVRDFYVELKRRGHKMGGAFLLTNPVFLPCDADTVRKVLAKDFQHFTDRTIYVNEKDDPLSGHLFALEGVRWRNMRVKLTPTFTSGKMRMMYPLLVECCKQLMESLKGFSRKQEPVYIKEYFARYTTDVIGTCAFGLECKSFEDEDATFRKMGKRLFESPGRLRAIRRFIITTFPEVAKALHFRLIRQDIEDFFRRIIGDTIRYRKDKGEVRKDFLQLLIDIKDKGELSLEEICAQCFLFFIAGFETSSTLAQFSFYELAKNQEVQERAREEVMEVLKKHNGELTYDSLQDLKYVEMVLEEALRKYPPVMTLVRKCTMDWKDSDTGTVVKSGESILISALGMHFDEEYFPNPEKFDPERFNEVNRPKIVPYSYLPFGEGPRNCIGLRFGMMQSKVGLATVLSKFRVTLSEKTVEPIIVDINAPINAPKDPIYVNVHEL